MKLSHRTRRRTTRTKFAAALALAFAAAFAAFVPVGTAFAQQNAGKPQTTPTAQSFPAWEQLTPEQRDALIATMRDHWNRNPQQRARIMNHAQRWRQMTPEQRQRALKGRHRWDQMTPQERARARAMFEQRQRLSPEQRADLREKLKAMTPEQRREWLKENRGKWQHRPHRPDMRGGDQGTSPPPPEPRS